MTIKLTHCDQKVPYLEGCLIHNPTIAQPIFRCLIWIGVRLYSISMCIFCLQWHLNNATDIHPDHKTYPRHKECVMGASPDQEMLILKAYEKFYANPNEILAMISYSDT